MSGRTSAHSNREYARGMARAAAGAVIFAFPLLMTMEMWWLGVYLDRFRLFLFLLFAMVMLVPLSWLVGFERTGSLLEDVLDAIVAFAIGAVTSTILLALFGIISTAMPLSEVVGKIAVQTVPASIGAMLARDQLGGGESERAGEKQGGYGRELFVMLVGAVFLAFNVAPTEEMILIAFEMTPLHALALIVLSIAILHAFVYALGFSGQETAPEGSTVFTRMFRHTIAGYGIAVLVSLYVLWTFGRTDGASPAQIAMMVSVLGFPSALGAASARLII